eukprot:1159189-Pelagomonas_calceolata.AAC.9
MAGHAFKKGKRTKSFYNHKDEPHQLKRLGKAQKAACHKNFRSSSDVEERTGKGYRLEPAYEGSLAGAEGSLVTRTQGLQDLRENDNTTKS